MTGKDEQLYNEVVKYAMSANTERREKGITKNIISRDGIRNQFGVSRGKASEMMETMQEQNIIDGYVPQKGFAKDEREFPLSITEKDLQYLGMDINGYDFANKEISVDTEIAIGRMIDKKPEMENFYQQVDINKCGITPVDGNATRVRCGDIKTGDIVEYKGIEYHYNYSAWMDCNPSHDKFSVVWALAEGQQGWGARAIGLPKIISDYKEDLESLNQPKGIAAKVYDSMFGKPITSMRYTYAYFTGITEVPNIPKTVKDITGMCYDSFSLQDVPPLPRELKYAEDAFVRCGELKSIGQIPSGLKTCKNMFVSCRKLDIDVSDVQKKYNINKIMRSCNTDISIKDDVLDEVKNDTAEVTDKIDNIGKSSYRQELNVDR